MGRPAYGGRATCESCISIDVRRLHREGGLVPGQSFSISWSRASKPLGSVSVRTESRAIVLMFSARGRGDNEREGMEQYVPVEWTRCHFGGYRPWFGCPVCADGSHCKRRVAKLYAGGELFACRHCYGLAYASQQENPRDRALRQAQKIRERLGGKVNVLDYPFPDKPRRMHWRTYQRLRKRGRAAEKLVNAEYMRLLSWSVAAS